MISSEKSSITIIKTSYGLFSQCPFFTKIAQDNSIKVGPGFWFPCCKLANSYIFVMSGHNDSRKCIVLFKNLNFAFWTPLVHTAHHMCCSQFCSLHCIALYCIGGRCLLSREGRTGPACHHHCCIQRCHGIRNQHQDILYHGWGAPGGSVVVDDNDCEYHPFPWIFGCEDPGFAIGLTCFYPNFGNWLGKR